ncbi:MAG: tetratricopeptide repeat protein [Deltaproteobacteria bacterium]|jgi:tetratricopeptide (TPR) repeat protein|nr:tetratricopeptide repeat protein [Deltaproteobacteria bacterium]
MGQKALLALALVMGLALINACGPLPPQDPFHLAEAKDSLNNGYYWYGRGCYKEAGRFFGEGLEFARLADSTPLIVMAQNTLGAAFLAQNRLTEAAEKLAEALELSLTLPEKPELDSVLGNLGTLAFQAKRPADALDFWTKATEAAPEPRKAIYLANLARLYQAENNAPLFATTVTLALAASQNSQTPIGARADALALGAALALDQGQTEVALNYVNQALDLDRKAENMAGLAQNLEILGRAQKNLDQIPLAAQSLDRSFYLYVALKDKTGANRLYETLKSTHQEKGYPKDLKPYQTVLKNPKAFDPLDKLCP